MKPLIDGDILRYEVGAMGDTEDGPASFEYVAEALRRALPNEVVVEAIAATVTSADGRAVSLPPEERAHILTTCHC